MQKKMQYSEKKFKSFSAVKKERVLVEFIRMIELCWDDKLERERLLDGFSVCLNTILSLDRQNIDLKSILHSLARIEDVQDFLRVTGDIFNVSGQALADFDILPVRGAFARPNRLNIPLFVVLDNLRSAFNVGSIIRTCECFGIKKMFFCGSTPTPDNPKVKKTAMGTEEHVEWEKVKDVLLLMDELKKTTTIVALETGETSKYLHTTELPCPATMIVGNEALGIDKKVMAKVDMKVKIPLFGTKQSYNVGVAFGIGCYEFVRQWDIMSEDDD